MSERDPKKLRLFVAFEVPDRHLEAIEDAISPWRGRIRGARWTSRHQQHVTLKFIGWMAPDRLEDVQSICMEVARRVARAEVSLADIGAFPNMRRARVVWVGINDPAGVTPRLAADLDDAFAPLGVDAEERAYTPHLTLARLKPPQDLRPLPDVYLPALDAFTIEAITLFRSHLGRGGPRYEVVQRSPLR